MHDGGVDRGEPVVSMAAAALAPRVRVPRSRTIGRPRVSALFDAVWANRLTLVVGAAGCGKTTALTNFAAETPYPVAWYRADMSDASVPRFLECLATALGACLPGFPTDWTDPVAMAFAIEAVRPERMALVIDDLHTVRSTPAEAAFMQFLTHAPPGLSTVASTRLQLDIDLSRLVLEGEVMHISSDDLRFRTWETEALFRDLYNLRIAPQELARLTRRVRGWPAGLRLYQLAARDKTPIEQRRLVDVLSTRSWAMRDYLTRNILDDLRPELREFLINTSVLGVVTPQLSDALLGRDDSQELLRELEALDLLTTPLDDSGVSHQFHEVLRAHLEARLLDRGEQAGRGHLLRAGHLLAEHGWTAEALRCFGRAHAWDAVASIVGTGEPSVGTSWAWLDTLPPAVVASDPWLGLSNARAKVAAGKLADGLDIYHRLEHVTDIPALIDACRRERSNLAMWLESRPVNADDWQARLRRATQRDPLRAFADCRLADPGMMFGSGVAGLLAGDLHLATRQLTSAASNPEAGPALLAAAQLAYAIALVLASGAAETHQIDLAEEAAERVEIGWLARLARSAFALTERSGTLDGDEPAWAMCDADGDSWGAALALLFDAWRVAKSDEVPRDVDFAALAERFQRLNAPVLETWVHALSAAALARSGREEVAERAAQAERHAHALQLPGPRAIALCALDTLDAVDAVEGAVGKRGASLLGLCGIDPKGLADGVERRAPEPAQLATADTPPRVLLFGSLQILVGDEAVDLTGLRPRARSLIRFLALNHDKLVHREALLEALWPNSGFDSGRANLHTAISAARHALDPISATIRRESDSYRLVMPPRTTWDVADFAEALRAAHHARRVGDDLRAYDAFVNALALYSDELLCEEGPGEWIVTHRDRFRNEAVGAAIGAAEIALANGDCSGVVTACERAIQLDPFADRAWRLMTAALEHSGERASAERCRQAYLEVQQRLGITVYDEETPLSAADRRGLDRGPGRPAQVFTKSS